MRKFWGIWGGLVQRLIASVGSQASLVGLVLFFAPSPFEPRGWTLLFVGLALAFAVGSAWLEVSSELKIHKRRKTYGRRDADGIKAYMRQWISESGRATIWTRDLSWANDSLTMATLKAKASTGNLTVCMPKMNEIGQALQSAGADICIYGTAGFDSPASRFTIAYSGNGGTQVAIGRADEGTHVIEELDASDPAIHMATDLVTLAKILSKQ